MRVFFSHASRQKPLLHEIQAHLPEHVRVEIDEDLVRPGDDVLKALKDQIDTKTD